jgi:MFS family permease
MTRTADADQSQTDREVAGSAFMLVASLVGIYIISQFFRSSTGVIGPDLAREFGLDASRLSLLSSLFFLSFAAAQIPLGVAIDRFGPKAAMLATAAIMIAATLMFAMAENFFTLALARLLLGIGCCSYLMAPLAIYAERFSPHRFAAMVGVQLGGGSLGMLVATKPLAEATATFGWRASFLGVAVFAACMTALVFLFVHESAKGKAQRRARAEGLGQALRGVAAAARVESFWRLFFMQAATYSAFAAILGLWGGPWLSQTYGMSLETRGFYLLIFAVFQIGGLFALGPVDRYFASYKRPSIIMAVFALALAALAAAAPLPVGALPYFLAAYGFALAYSPLLTAHGKSLFPPELTGRGLTLLNMGTIGGVFVQQTLTAWLVEMFGSTMVDGVKTYPPAAYRAVFAIIALELLLALALYFRARDPHPARAGS